MCHLIHKNYIYYFMISFIDFVLREEYEQVKRIGDKLSEIDLLINWEAFRPIITGLYNKNI